MLAIVADSHIAKKLPSVPLRDGIGLIPGKSRLKNIFAGVINIQYPTMTIPPINAGRPMNVPIKAKTSHNPKMEK